MLGEMRLRGLRGATTVEDNTAAAIINGTLELLEAMMDRNNIDEEKIVSIIFTATEDLSAEFPAAAARKLGFTTVPLLCAREIAVPDSTARCIRILMHFYTDCQPQELRHVYLNEAKHLRTDLPE